MESRLPGPRMTFDYAHRTLTEAVGTLAAGSGTIQQRLRDAFVQQLDKLDPRDLPESLKEPFLDLCDAMTTPAVHPGESEVEVWTDAMSTQDAYAWARMIVRLQESLSQLRAR